MHTRKSLFEELSNLSVSDVETRAENAFAVGAKFVMLLKSEISDEKAFDLMMKAWFRAVKDNDFGKFKRTYRKYSTDSNQSKPT